MKRLLGLLFACLVLALVATGCGGDDDSDSGSSGGGGGGNADQPAPTAEDNGGTSAGGGGGGTGPGAQVTMKDIKFHPGSVTIKPGGKVTWTNDDSVGHDVTGDSLRVGQPRRHRRRLDLLAHLQEGRDLQLRVQRAPRDGGDRQGQK